MIDGLFYKCPLVASASQAIKQFTFDKKAENLIKKYKPCSLFDTEKEIEGFFNNLENPITQCSLCDYSTDRFKLSVKLYPLDRQKLKAR